MKPTFHAHLNVSDLILGVAAMSRCDHGCSHQCHHRARHRPARHCAPPPCAVVHVAAPPPAPMTTTGAYIRIVRASYGAGGHWLDVTDVLQRLVMGQGGLSLNAFGSRRSMNALFGDPVYGKAKRLEFTYEVVGQPKSLTLSEDRKLSLTMADMYHQSVGAHVAVPQEAAHFSLVLLQSSYGIGECRYDVASVLGNMAAQQGGRGVTAFGYFFSPNGCMNKAFGDPAPGMDKDLRVSYLWRTPVMSCSAAEDQQVHLSYAALSPCL